MTAEIHVADLDKGKIRHASMRPRSNDRGNGAAIREHSRYQELLQ